MQIEFTQPIYSFDIDSGQHVSNIVYINWLEIGRLRLLEAAGMPIHRIKQKSVTSDLFSLVTKQELSYGYPSLNVSLPQ